MDGEIASCHKDIAGSIEQSKEWYSSIKEREAKLKLEIKDRWTQPSEQLKQHILHVQNEAIINYLVKCKKHLDAVKTSPSISYIKVSEMNIPCPRGKMEKLLLGLKKMYAIIEYSEREEQKTSESIETQVFPFKATIKKLTEETVKIARELTIEIHTTKNHRYLQRKLFVLGNPVMFPTDRDKSNFLNSVFFDSTIKTFSTPFKLSRSHALGNRGKSFGH
eukprot:TRINITY_DN11116_c0_g1_i1.p3 TRINITY_DN11116_c0_g1~~TRINITY_DN11116_c0_g1_i1.p3  ORF type:complete len:220 (-),score=45.98 TRINITY_DN11116_c0_g1_i1:308-967(-)